MFSGKKKKHDYLCCFKDPVLVLEVRNSKIHIGAYTSFSNNFPKIPYMQNYILVDAIYFVTFVL